MPRTVYIPDNVKIPAAGVLRRTFLCRLAALGFPAVHARAAGQWEGGNAETTPGFWERPRWVWLRRPATGEQLRVVYWNDGRLLEDAYRQVSWLLRDVRFERMLAARHPAIAQALGEGRIRQEHLSPWVLMDPVLLDVLYAYSAWLSAFGMSRPLDMTSGFRHLITNDMTEGAARASHHVRGEGADLTVPGVNVVALAQFGRYLQVGGVGLYQSRNFLHIDRGRVRSWVG